MDGMSHRHPRWVYDAGDEPDPRFSLANERTFLAWVRTALAMMAGGVALHSLGVPGAAWIRLPLVLGLVVAGAVLTVLALVRWAQVERAMRERTRLPAFSLGIWATLTIVVVAGLLAATLAAT
jgi:putative membrane protein